jgi:hypothetical protein
MNKTQLNQLIRVLRELYPDKKPGAPGVPVAVARCTQAVSDGVMSLDEGRAFVEAHRAMGVAA